MKDHTMGGRWEKREVRHFESFGSEQKMITVRNAWRKKPGKSGGYVLWRREREHQDEISYIVRKRTERADTGLC
jgi:hypothetical protein